MHVRVRPAVGQECVVPLVSKLSRIEELRRAIEEKFSIPLDRQRLFYGGKLLENGYSLHDYSIKLNDVIQLIVRAEPQTQDLDTKGTQPKKEEKTIVYEDAESKLYAVGDLIDMRDRDHGAWFEGTIIRIVRDPDYTPPVKVTNKTNNNRTNGDTEVIDTERIGHPVAQTSETKNDNETSITSTPKMTNGNLTPKSGKVSSKSTPKTNCESSKNGENSKSPVNGNSSPITPNRRRGIADYFTKTPNSSKVLNEKTNEQVNDKVNDKDKGNLDKNLENEDKVNHDDNNGKEKVNHVKFTGSSLTNGEKITNGEQCELLEKDETVNDDAGIMYQISLVYDDAKEELSHYCKSSEIRPRSRVVIPADKLELGRTVMVNHNTEDTHEKGYWYDFIVHEVVKQRKSVELVGTLLLGAQAVPQNDTKVKVIDKIYAIEEVVPIDKRTAEYSKLMKTPTEQRALPLHCTSCRDNEKLSCRDCGCHICAGKEEPEKIVLCDECNMGFHMGCLTPPMSALPEEDWYCPSCKRDPNDVVAPGAARQLKKAGRGKGQRDWGRGMACVGKTQTCAMPANHFGPIPGVEVGMAWRFRIQLSESGVHRPPVSGIHGRDTDGAYSLVLSGGYEDDVDNGTEFTYTGSGGRDLSGNKRTADQSSDQQLTRENRALARSCAAPLSDSGGDAGAAWRDGKPVRVTRSYKMLKHFPEYAPEQGIRYDGIYKVVKYYPETGKSGFRVWKYLLRRDDPSPPPWEPDAPKYPIIFPEGYLEAEAEKKKVKETKTKAKKRVLRESNHSDDESRTEPTSDGTSVQSGRTDGSESPPLKKMKREDCDTPPVKKGRGRPRKSQPDSPAPVSPFTIASKNTKLGTSESSSKTVNQSPTKPKGNIEDLLTTQEMEAIKSDELNAKLWQDCLDICRSKDKQSLLSHVQQIFLCIICQEVAANPVTTECQHNFCMSCLKLAFRSTDTNSCPYCRQDLSKNELQYNENLKAALRKLMPGYDIGKK